jgi:hypothetical protein
MVIYGQWGRLRVILPKMLHLLGLNLQVISLASVILGGTGQCWGFDISGGGHGYDYGCFLLGRSGFGGLRQK